MTNQQALLAILTPAQLERFCEQFGLAVSDLEPNFVGWTKHVIVSPDLVFLFTRHPQVDIWLEKELDIYRPFKTIGDDRLPNLVRIVEDDDVSYYRFGAITRVRGIALSTIESDLTLEQCARVLREFGRTIALWHQIPLGDIPGTIQPKFPDEEDGFARHYRWMRQALFNRSTDEALCDIRSLAR